MLTNLHLQKLQQHNEPLQRFDVLIVHALCACHHVDQSAAVASHINGYAASILAFLTVLA